jgi:hypothetical protein
MVDARVKVPDGNILPDVQFAVWDVDGNARSLEQPVLAGILVEV